MTELEKQVLKEKYPQLSLSEDTDIERYFELRKTGFLNEALLLYNRKLKQKYPDDNIRIELMACYRKKSPKFQELLTVSLIKLAQKTIVQIKQTITAITNKLAGLNLNDVYSVVQNCEQIVSAISNDKFAAISFTQKFARYAAIINFKTIEMKKSAELIRLYVTDTLSSVKAYKDEQAAAYREEQRQKKVYNPKPAFDFSKIIFTKEQKDAIVIPSSIKSIEDQVIAYTLKYWTMFANSAFENAVLLYSRKYKTNHFNIFQAIKIGRMRNWKDEEILQAVLLNVVNGYYYSISGDLYLQRQWFKSKAAIENKNKKVLNLPPPNKKTAKAKIVTPKKKTIDKKENKISNITQTDKITKNNKQAVPTEKIQKKQNIENQKQENKTVTQTAIDTKVELTKQPEVIFSTVPTVKNNSSISELIKQMSGAKYKIYKGLFFDNIRPIIRKHLEPLSSEKTSSFGGRLKAAEDLIYEFFEDNYDNPYQNWQESKEYKKIPELGFKLIKIEPIISDWVNKFNI